MDTRAQACKAFLDAYDGDASAALLDFASRAEIAVAWIDRKVVELHIGRDLTNEEWRLLTPKLEDYDQHISTYDDPEGEFIDTILKEAGVKRS